MTESWRRQAPGLDPPHNQWWEKCWTADTHCSFSWCLNCWKNGEELLKNVRCSTSCNPCAGEDWDNNLSCGPTAVFRRLNLQEHPSLLGNALEAELFSTVWALIHSSLGQWIRFAGGWQEQQGGHCRTGWGIKQHGRFFDWWKNFSQNWFWCENKFSAKQYFCKYCLCSAGSFYFFIAWKNYLEVSIFMAKNIPRILLSECFNWKIYFPLAKKSPKISNFFLLSTYLPFCNTKSTFICFSRCV